MSRQIGSRTLLTSAALSLKTKNGNVSSFYCSPNIGDEAMLAGMRFWLGKLGHEVITQTSVRLRSFRGNVVNALDRGKAQECDVLVIGGGDPGVGFGWNLIPFALAGV